MEGIFFDITIVIVLAACITILFRFLKQPAILAYILTGILLGPVGLFHLENSTAIETLGQVGITLLLFMLGLELKFQDLKSIGKTAIVAGVLQMILTITLGFSLALVLGFSQTIAFYVGIALGFSSTIIIVKLLSDARELNSLHGKLAIGILLAQDFFAIMTIIMLSGATSDASGAFLQQLGFVLLKLIVLFGWIFVLSKFIFPRLIPKISGSNESLFLFSLGWVFLFAAVVTSWPINFSVEIGGFLAGLALANTAENLQIVAKMKSLRDFFITIFFVSLGLHMTFGNIQLILLPAVVLSLFVIFGKPLVVMGITGFLGYKKRTSFLVGTSLSQVSEFSLIILFIGNQQGAIPDEVITMVVLVAIVSFAGSTYAIQNGKKLFNRFSKYLGILEGKYASQEHSFSGGDEIYKDHVIVIGAHQMGQSIMRTMERTGEQVLIVDFNPDVTRKLREQGESVLFGDITDEEIQEKAGIERAKIIISTVPDLEDNMQLLDAVKRLNKKAKIVVMAYEGSHAKQLYKAGADYVVLPHLAGGRHLAKILIDKNHLELIEEYKTKDLSFFN